MNAPTHIDQPRIHRIRRDRIIFGVCSGLGEYFDVDPVLVRLAFVLVTLAGGAGVLAYLVLAIVLPAEDVAEAEGRTAIRQNIESLGTEAGEIAGTVRNSLADISDPDRAARRHRNHQLGALFLIALGLLLLAGDLGWFWWFRWELFWPLVLIVAGIAILLRHNETA